MNKKDKLKEHRLQEEVKFVNTDWIELLARSILDEHTELVNENIFSPLGGKLTYSITLGAPNAGIAQGGAEPYSPRMEIRLKLIEEIYRDAFSFALISNRLSQETETLKSLHEISMFSGAPYIFKTGLPKVKIESVAHILRLKCILMEQAQEKIGDKRIGQNEIRCRFILFELMLTWTFYHEVGHALQQHYILRAEENSVAYLNESMMDWDLEPNFPIKDGSMKEIEYINTNPQTEDSNLAAQARELMADIEGIGIVLSYLANGGRLNFDTNYLLNCALSCMFQRFYNSYQEDLTITTSRHPHPAVRDNIIQFFVLETVAKLLLYKKEISSFAEIIPALTYLNTRSNIFTGLFRSHRIEMREDKGSLPSYMRLLGEEYSGDMKAYIEKLLPHIQRQISRVMDSLHIKPEKSVLPRWIEELEARNNLFTTEHSNQDSQQ